MPVRAILLAIFSSLLYTVTAQSQLLTTLLPTTATPPAFRTPASVRYWTPPQQVAYLPPLDLVTPLPQQSLPSCYVAEDLAFFCRLEVRLEKVTQLPVRFRLGDVQQVDYLERKFTGWRYGY